MDGQVAGCRGLEGLGMNCTHKPNPREGSGKSWALKFFGGRQIGCKGLRLLDPGLRTPSSKKKSRSSDHEKLCSKLSAKHVQV